MNNRIKSSFDARFPAIPVVPRLSGAIEFTAASFYGAALFRRFIGRFKSHLIKALIRGMSRSFHFGYFVSIVLIADSSDVPLSLAHTASFYSRFFDFASTLLPNERPGTAASDLRGGTSRKYPINFSQRRFLAEIIAIESLSEAHAIQRQLANVSVHGRPFLLANTNTRASRDLSSSIISETKRPMKKLYSALSTHFFAGPVALLARCHSVSMGKLN